MAVILVAEDDDDLRMMIKESLERRRHTVIEAGNGREAMNKFNSSVTDIVIVDLLMPEQDGIGMIIDLRKIKPDVKIVAISGGGKIGPSKYLEVAETLGADAVFAKPFSLKGFIDEIEKLAAVT